jgi:hypothetical protein
MVSQEARCFFDPSLRIYAILWPPCGVCWTLERKVFSYNKRTMDWAMGPFSPLWHFLGINNLRAVNIVISSTPVASTTIYFIINKLQAYFSFVQQVLPAGFMWTVTYPIIALARTIPFLHKLAAEARFVVA